MLFVDEKRTVVDEQDKRIIEQDLGWKKGSYDAMMQQLDNRIAAVDVSTRTLETTSWRRPKIPRRDRASTCRWPAVQKSNP